MRIRAHEIPLAAQFTRHSRTLVVVVFVLLFFPRFVAAQTATKNDPVDREFLTWARQNLHPVATVAHGAP